MYSHRNLDILASVYFRNTIYKKSGRKKFLHPLAQDPNFLFKGGVNEDIRKLRWCRQFILSLRSDKLLTIISLTPLLALGQQLAVHVTQSQVFFVCVCVCVWRVASSKMDIRKYFQSS